MLDKKIISLDELSRFKTNCDSEYQKTLVSGTNIKSINNTSLLGSGNYEFDSALSEISTNAVQNKVVSKEFAEVNYELAIIREELFETILTEIDYQENFAISYTIPDTLSDTDGTHRVVFSETALKTIEFNSVVYSQVFNYLVAGSSGTLNHIAFTNNNDGSWTLNGTATANTIITLIYGYQSYLKSGHKYLFVCDNSKGTNGKANIIDSYGTLVFNTSTQRIARYNSGTVVFSILVRNGDTCDNEKIMPQVFDLTQMDLDSVVTVDEAISELAKRGIDVSVYNQYSAGEIRNTTATGIQVKDSSNNVLGTISVPQTSGKSALNVHDYIEVVEGNIVEGEQLYNLVLHTLVGFSKIKDLNWTYVYIGYFQDNDFYIKPPADNGSLANVRCAVLSTDTANNVYNGTDLTIGATYPSGRLRIRDNSISTLNDLLNKYGEYYIYYELAIPTIQTIATDLRFDQISSLIQQGGTINALFTNTPPNVTTTFVVKKAVGE